MSAPRKEDQQGDLSHRGLRSTAEYPLGASSWVSPEGRPGAPRNPSQGDWGISSGRGLGIPQGHSFTFSLLHVPYSFIQGCTQVIPSEGTPASSRCL